MEHTVEITSLAYGGAGIGRIGGKVVFVPFTAPGDVARVRIVAGRKGYSEGELIEVESPSPLRAEPVCEHYGVCGGCALQHMEYGAQLEWKKRIFVETMRRIGTLAEVPVEGSVPCPTPYGYRSRARFHASGGSIGFFETKSHRVVDIRSCPVLDERVDRAYGSIREALRAAGAVRLIETFDVALSPSDSAVVASFRLTGRTDAFDWVKLLSGVGGLKGFDMEGKGPRISSGEAVVRYSVAGLAMETGVGEFTQANLTLNDALVARAVACAGLAGVETAVDLFSGAGNFTLPLAKEAKEATGVESGRSSVLWARANAGRNGISNAVFHAEGAGEWLKNNSKGLEKQGRLVVVLDPPRGGEAEVARALADIRPGRIVYVSCAPPTLARDVAILVRGGYGLTGSTIVDMFPQTFHIECVAALELL